MFYSLERKNQIPICSSTEHCQRTCLAYRVLAPYSYYKHTMTWKKSKYPLISHSIIRLFFSVFYMEIIYLDAFHARVCSYFT